MQVILIALSIYLLYRFIFGFLIPVINTTTQVRKQFTTMKDKMEEAYNQQKPGQPATAGNAAPLGKTTSGKPGATEDYIEYEEL
ncbi:MAG: hypothetical protein ABIX01_07290 [Chitinophagaceae bacterium]